MQGRLTRGMILQQLSRTNQWWTDQRWEHADIQLQTAARAAYQRRPEVLDDITPPNLYTLRGPRRVGKSTVLKQTISRLCGEGIDPHRICYFPADAIETSRDLINVFQAARQLFPDLGDTPRYFLIDEITTVRDWQRGIKWLRDNTPVAFDCVVVTGSSASDVAGGAFHLAGRRGPDVNLDRLLLPMSFPEFVRCAGYSPAVPPKLPFHAFYTEDGRDACNDALVHIGTLVDAFDVYLQIGGFPQAVTEFRRSAMVSPGFARDLWDVIRSDLHRQGVSRPEQCLTLLEQIVASLASRLSMQTIANRLDIDRRTAGAWIDALANSYLLLVVFKESSGVPDVNSLRKVYPIDPAIAHLPSRHSPGVSVPRRDKTRRGGAGLGHLPFGGRKCCRSFLPTWAPVLLPLPERHRDRLPRPAGSQSRRVQLHRYAGPPGVAGAAGEFRRGPAPDSQCRRYQSQRNHPARRGVCMAP